MKDGLEKKTDEGQGDQVVAIAKIQVKEAEAEPRRSECELKKQRVHSPIVNGFLFYMILIALHLYHSKFKRYNRKYSESLPPTSCPHSIPHSRGSFLYILPKMFYTWTNKLYIHERDIYYIYMFIYIYTHKYVCMTILSISLLHKW